MPTSPPPPDPAAAGTNRANLGELDRWGRGKSLMPVFAALAGALAGLALVMGQTIVAQRAARAQATAERSVLIALNGLMLAMVEAESGQRGYVLTGARIHLAPYLAARPLCDQAIATIRALGMHARDPAGDPGAGEKDARRLQQLTDAKFIEMDRTVRLAQAGMREQAVAIIRADLGRIQMTAIRQEIARQSAKRETLHKLATERLEVAERRLLPLIGLLGAAILALVHAGLRAERSRAQAAAEAEQASALRQAHERTELLARELNHRVKNLFSVVLSIVSLSGRKQASSREVAADIAARIRALSLAHSASQGAVGSELVRLGPLVTKTMEPYAIGDGTRVRIAGPEVELPSSMVTPIGLIVHELATNAVKYGALSVDEGTVEIRWDVARGADGTRHLELSWTERGGPRVVEAGKAAPAGSGFGVQMTTMAAAQLGGAIVREWPPEGAIVRLTFPLPQREPGEG